jgi:Amt family ammonium transporter
MMKHRFGYDDSLDAFGIHGIGGAFGAVATGLFATVGAGSLLTGDIHQLGIQILGVVAAGLYAATVTALILLVLRPLMGLRVTKEEELMGLDQTDHSEAGYNF